MAFRSLVLATVIGIAMHSGQVFAGGKLDGSWVLVELGGRKISLGSSSTPRMTITGNEVSGFDGCNTFSGRLDKKGSFVATQMACAGEFVGIPLDFNDVGSHMRAAKVSDGKLILPAKGDAPSSVFRKE